MKNRWRTIWGKLTKKEQIQLKAWVSMLGLGLLLLLLGVRVLTTILEYDNQGKQQETVPEHVPVIQLLTNVWIMDADEEKMQIFQEGTEKILWFDEPLKENIMPQQAAVTQVTAPEVEKRNPEHYREQIADIQLTDGIVTGVWIKPERIHGNVLSADGTGLEIEGYGRLPLAADYKGYRLYNTLVMCTAEDLPFGYDFADFCVENGEICGILMAKEAAMEYIRVLVKTSDYAGLLHKEIVLTADCDFSLQYGTGDAIQTEYFAAGTEVTLKDDSSYFMGDRMRIVPSVLTGKIYLKNVSRSSGNSGYRGHLELQKAEDGIAVINELLLEEYLYSVVPSEMPASYPAEALQAQAICARTYAYGYMLHAGYPQYGAHVDDSTSYQVYNNIAEQESATTAVKETFGQLLVTAENDPAETFYYSTSCGVGTDAGVWSGDGMSELAYLTSKVHNFTTLQKEVELRNMEDGLDYPQMEGQTESLTEKPSMAMAENVPQLLSREEAFSAYITVENPDDLEVNEIWYRWKYHVPELNRKTILKALQSRYAANPQLVLTLKDGEYISAPIKELSQIKELYIFKRGNGGVAAELVIDTGKHTYKVLTENSIRYVLCSGEDVVIRQDGSESTPGTLLPSGFFVLEAEKAGGKEDGKVIGYKLTGGGFGHGVGMSQNGAKNMAAAGYKAEDILKFYYEGCDVRHIYTE